MMGKDETGLTWRRLLEESAAKLQAAGIADAKTDAWYLLEAAFGLDRVHYYMEQNQQIREERLAAGWDAYCESLEKMCIRDRQSAVCMAFCIIWQLSLS